MARVGLGLSADNLSERSGVSRVTIARFESGHSVAEASVSAIVTALGDAGAHFTRKAGRIGVTVPE